MMSEVGTIRLMLQALKRHKVEARVVKNACMALATIVEADGNFIPKSRINRILERPLYPVGEIAKKTV